ncbi:FAD-dependent oxidoreductase [Rhabdaerophilum calidifontis]|uniref:FAD-dependent oxidoreductase n=1 Tax=Rhabdaerophilum calidifontis TaxID=2604328 RepID=UPI003CCC7A3D
MARVIWSEEAGPPRAAGLVIVGAGAAGLVAALRARAAGMPALLIERNAVPAGSTALSAGLIPAAGTRFQRMAGIADSEALFAADIRRKAHDEPDPERVRAVVGAIGPALEWLGIAYGLPFTVVEDFTYPGHSVRRMHGLPSRSGAELVDRLRAAAEAAGADLVTEARAETLVAAPDGRILGLGIVRPDGSTETFGIAALILACNGYGGNPALVAEHIPAMAGALYFGHPGNRGDALAWGRALGARTGDLAGHQGHGSVAHPHGILITWATMTEGGFQVNQAGQRFANEACGYSEHAAALLAEPGGIGFSIFDARIAGIARQFEDFRRAEAQGAILTAPDIETLAGRIGVPEPAFRASFSAVEAAKSAGLTDAWGRDWRGIAPLAPPFHAVRVTGALFHTQGGLCVDADRRVLRTDGTPFPNLFAAGGAAIGVSGRQASGYLSGNGLLTAVADGFVAGAAAARLVAQAAA